MPGVMTHYMERKMDKLDIPPIPEFIEQVKDIITVGEFYALAAGGQIIFT